MDAPFEGGGVRPAPGLAGAAGALVGAVPTTVEVAMTEVAVGELAGTVEAAGAWT